MPNMQPLATFWQLFSKVSGRPKDMQQEFTVSLVCQHKSAKNMAYAIIVPFTIGNKV